MKLRSQLSKKTKATGSLDAKSKKKSKLADDADYDISLEKDVVSRKDYLITNSDEEKPPKSTLESLAQRLLALDDIGEKTSTKSKNAPKASPKPKVSPKPKTAPKPKEAKEKAVTLEDGYFTEPWTTAETSLLVMLCVGNDPRDPNDRGAIAELTKLFNEAAGKNFPESRIRTKLSSAEVLRKLGAAKPKIVKERLVEQERFPLFDGVPQLVREYETPTVMYSEVGSKILYVWPWVSGRTVFVGLKDRTHVLIRISVDAIPDSEKKALMAENCLAPSGMMISATQSVTDPPLQEFLYPVPKDAIRPSNTNCRLLKSKRRRYFGIVFTKDEDFEGQFAVTSLRKQQLRNDQTEYETREEARAALAALSPESMRALGVDPAILQLNNAPPTPSMKVTKERTVEKERKETQPISEQLELEEIGSEEMHVEAGTCSSDDTDELEFSSEEKYADSDETVSEEGSSENHSS